MTALPAFDQIALDLEDEILTLTLNRPDKLNAFTPTMRDEMIAALDYADATDTVRAVIVTGAGRAFCAGADLARGGADAFNYRKSGRFEEDGAPEVWRDGGGQVSLRLFKCLKPVIAAVNGPAVGVGITMQLPMDIRLASTTARFGFVFTRRGVVPEACSSWFLPRIVGISKALEWTYSGRVFEAEEARAAGLVRSLHAPDELLPAARAIAREIAQTTSAVSIAMTRQMMWRMLGADDPMEAHKIDSRGIFALGAGADAKEGVASFLEKRPPAFTDRVSADMPDFYPWWEDRPFS